MRPAFCLLLIMLLPLLSAQGCPPPQSPDATQEAIADITAFAERAFAEAGAVAGMSLAVVQGDEVLLLHGLGQRNIEQGLPVTPQTGFYLASSTKSFLGLTAALLAERGELDLDAPVADFLPTMELPEPLDPTTITLRDLLTHRHRIFSRAAQEQLAFREAVPLETFLEITAQDVRATPPGFFYTNMGYNVMGYVLEAATGKPWQTLVQEEILTPLAMTTTTSSIEAAQSGNFALPYAFGNGAFAQLETKADAAMHAAGGLVASAEDLAVWVQAQLQQGMVGGEQVLPRAAFVEAHTPHETLDAGFYKFQRNAYGLGWYHADFAGENMMHHFGGFDGYQAHVSFMPEHNLGVVALVSSTAHSVSAVPHLVAAYAYERLLEKPDVDARYEEDLQALLGQVQARVLLQDRLDKASAAMPEKVDEATRLIRLALTEALAAHVTSQGAINNLGYSYVNDGAPNMALAVFAFNTEAFPNVANPHDSYGEALEALGRLEEAEQAYARAVALSDPSEQNYETFQKNLARVQQKLGQ